ncbi:DUF1003 domain-containing protein [Blastopirellula marina]|uniref:DUF1003 domain-containing protein n=1 Tax=Blastopirellula marina TaxID=124 RepID=A0A2S8F6T4_9BACT|nr:DUF1003 domain-containing protein [Blastopirellula marina]PQO27871.1 hypothetical protein C5Y98_26450 [Blastopirellula marina]PTL41606.1 DUF1003 domain-containing protein [Blastopirellula marina]
MTKRHVATSACSICHQTKPLSELAPGESIREAIATEILQANPAWTSDQPVCNSCLNRFRAEHFRRLLEEEKGELSDLEMRVLDSLREQDSIAANVNDKFEQQLSFGDRVSDQLANFGGSWAFLILFGLVVVVWMILNSVLIAQEAFDPYPFILLNLVLSCLAAIQAPVILMSQNRQEAKDRLRSEYDFEVNFRAELEIRLLHTKLDQLLSHQWQRLLEIQQLQLELMEELAERRDKPRRS